MPIYDRSVEELCRVACDEEVEEPYMLIKGTVTLNSRLSARYAIHLFAHDVVQYWVVDLIRRDQADVTFLLEYHLNTNGFVIVDPGAEEEENFPDCDVSRILTREQALSSGLTEDLFALVDEILLSDADVQNHADENMRLLHCYKIGPIYATDAQKLVPRLLKDEVPCDIHLQVGEDWRCIESEELPHAETRDLCVIYIPKEHEDAARYHERKLFPDGTLYFQEFDQGPAGWLDENTAFEEDILETMQQLNYQLADLQRQHRALSEEIDAVEKEMADPASQWRLPALQRAQQQNRQQLSRIVTELNTVEQRRQQLNYSEDTDDR